MNDHNYNGTPLSPDMSAFTSRLRLAGTLVFDSAHRIGAERSLAVDAPDLPILRTVDGRPYIPGSSLKGAWRAYTESVLRALEEKEQVTADNLACLITTEPCLPDEKVKEIKQERGLEKPEQDEALREASCWTCRVFGNTALASKVLIKDLMVREGTFFRTEERDGVAIDRDAGRAAPGQLYQYEVVPAGAAFELEVVVENGSRPELGLVMIGLRAFERGDVLVGGAKSRGLGWCRVEPAWNDSYYVAPDNLLDYLLGDEEATALADDSAAGEWLKALRKALTGQEGENA